MTTARQLSLDDAFARIVEVPAPPPHRPVVDGAWSAYVAGENAPLPIAASSVREAEAVAAAVAGTTPDRVLAIPAREGDFCADLMAALGRMNERAEEDLRTLRELHAQLLGCPVEELDARMAADEAKRAAERAARVPTRSTRGASGTKGDDFATRRLTDRQRELLACVEVRGNVAVYTRKERIPDWPALKAVLVALGGTWKRAKGGFLFPDDVDAMEKVRLAIATGEILDPRAADFFPTPAGLADRLVALAEVTPDHAVLEPSAGRGAIVEALRRAGHTGRLVAIERLPDNVTALAAIGVEADARDFLAIEPTGPIDRVVMNPPFGGRADVAHVRHALRWLAPGGRLVSVMSAGVAYRDDRIANDFRALVEARGGRIEPNPDGSFAESGTGVRTVTVVIPAEVA